MGSLKNNQNYPPKKPPLSSSQNERFERYMKLAAVALHPAKSQLAKKDGKPSNKD
jgi:hypothetical protein